MHLQPVKEALVVWLYMHIHLHSVLYQCVHSGRVYASSAVEEDGAMDHEMHSQTGRDEKHENTL